MNENETSRKINVNDSESNTSLIGIPPALKAHICILYMFQKHLCDLNLNDKRILWSHLHCRKSEIKWNLPEWYSMKVVSSTPKQHVINLPWYNRYNLSLSITTILVKIPVGIVNTVYEDDKVGH